MEELLTSFGFKPAEAREFVELVSAKVSDLGYYDLQYRPFLHIATAYNPHRRSRTPPETMHLPALVSTTSILRNVQIANRIRFPDLPHIFVHVLYSLFKTRFEHVTSNQKVQTAQGETDVDVAVFAGTTIYLFECKHSVFPAGPHEMRDLLEDIEKGVGQVKLAMAALSSPEARHRYLSRWFPTLGLRDAPELAVSGAILCSHRVLSGVEWDGVPVRDYSSISKLIEDGVIHVTTAVDKSEFTVRGFRLVDEGGFSTRDLDDYLSTNSRYFSAYRRFMRPMCRSVRIRNLTIAYETYVLNLTSNELAEHLEELGAVPLPAVRHELKPPKSWHAWVAERSDPGEKT